MQICNGTWNVVKRKKIYCKIIRIYIHDRQWRKVLYNRGGGGEHGLNMTITPEVHRGYHEWEFLSEFG